MIGHEPDEQDPDLRFDPGASFRTEARRRLGRAMMWTVILVVSVPISLLLVLYVCHLLAKAGVHPYLTWTIFFLGGVGSLAASLQISTHQPLDSKWLSDWMTGPGRKIAFWVVVVAVTVSVSVGLLAKHLSSPFETDAVPTAANVFPTSLFVWATLVAYRLKPLLDGYTEMRKRRWR